MNINYLFSIITLYLTKEEERKTNLNIVKQVNNKVRFNFSMNQSANDVTTFVLPYDIVMQDTNLTTMLKTYKQNLMIIDEKYEYNKIDQTCYYYALLNNGRVLTFNNFSIEEVNNIRNVLYDIKIQKEEIRVIFDEEEDERPKAYRLQEAGFTSYRTLFLVTVCFLGILILSLWLFKSII